MQRSLVIIAIGATVAVGALGLSAASAYAVKPTSSGGTVSHAPELVVPAGYQPTKFAPAPVRSAGRGVTTVAPAHAVHAPTTLASSADTSKAGPAGATPPAPGTAPSPTAPAGPQAGPPAPGAPAPAPKPGQSAPAAPPAPSGSAPAPAPAPKSGPPAPGSNKGNDVKNKGPGVNPPKGGDK